MIGKKEWKVTWKIMNVIFVLMVSRLGAEQSVVKPWLIAFTVPHYLALISDTCCQNFTPNYLLGYKFYKYWKILGQFLSIKINIGSLPSLVPCFYVSISMINWHRTSKINLKSFLWTWNLTRRRRIAATIIVNGTLVSQKHCCILQVNCILQ